MTNLSQAVYFDIKKRMNKLIEFINHEKAQYISEEQEKLLRDSHLMLVLEPLETIKSSLSPQEDRIK
jgi:hypothetical protein